MVPFSLIFFKKQRLLKYIILMIQRKKICVAYLGAGNITIGMFIWLDHALLDMRMRLNIGMS